MEDHSPSYDDLSWMEHRILERVLIPPPIHPEDPGPLPESILLDPHGYISDRTNDTTADGVTKDGKLIQVTFWAARPPRGSCFTVCIPNLDRPAFGDMPKILCTDEDLVLLRVPICFPGCNFHPEDNNYFVYQAGTKDKRPSLQLIPTPPALFFSDSDAGLLRRRSRRRNMYYIALLCQTSAYEQYNLHLFDSKSMSWSNKLMFIDSPKAKEYAYSSKVITIGGERGSVGWVDLWRGILICDLLRNNNHLHYIPLPSPLVPKLSGGLPLRVRDINVIGKEYIKFFDMQLHTGPGPVTEGWEAAIWRRKVSSTEWEEGCRMEVSNDSAFPNLQEDEPTGRPILKGVYSGYPALSLHDDDVVYVMDKNDLLDRNASVIAVDMRKKTVKGMADFGSRRILGHSFVYFQSAISKYLGLWSATRYQGNGAGTRKNRIAQAGNPKVPVEGVQ